MKFNEKLIELRKKEGLSQEELGYKLNVTRQTVSKWELGQTTPEMDKLIEMSKMFNITVDDLINESETQTNENPIIEDQPITKENVKEKNTKNILIGILIVVIVLIVVRLFAGLSIFNKSKDIQENVLNSIENSVDAEENIIERFFEIFERILGLAEKNINDMEENDKNFEETQDRILNIIEDQTTPDNQEQNQNNIENFGGTDEKVVNKMEISKFNGFIELGSGTQMGILIRETLDEIITSNKTNYRKITIKYGEIETQKEEEIKNIKQGMGDFDKYEVSFEYDEDGFINKAIIEKL